MIFGVLHNWNYPLIFTLFPLFYDSLFRNCCVLLLRGGFVDAISPKMTKLPKGALKKLVTFCRKEKMMDRLEQNKLYAKIPVEELLASEENQESLEELSAADLLNLLDQDVKFVAQFEKSKLEGIEVLLEAMAVLKQNSVEERLDRFVAHTLKFHNKENVPSEAINIEKKRVHLAMAAQQLQQQASEIALRELECDQVTIDLLEVQKKLLSELDEVLERLEDRDDGNSSQPLRHVA
ncbi:hypothetical protein MNBD_PLANCTO02-162 [hydrothermal vent metagenome]|uniref:Uncharacterized protein n=1 Tax=hydrothermal vent metagenome TaxID=652676 RepID=A0A3B1E658_9ZZZZ